MLRKDTDARHSIVLGNTLIREVEMEVVFGTPSKNCAGAGVCLIANRFPEGYKIPCPHTPAIMHYLPGSELVLRFRKHRLDDAIRKAYLSTSHFVVEESFLLPKWLVQRWSLPVSSIPSGIYTLEEYSKEFRLYFPL